MGNFDKWTTPKQIKIERAGDPRPIRRGPMKKGDRKKGRKARTDEVLSALNTWKLYQKWYEGCLTEEGWWKKRMKENMEKYKTKYFKLRDAFTKEYPLQ